MCTGRVDLAFVIRALQKGADGVVIAGCWPGECHYVTEGNYDALANMYLGKKLLDYIGVDPRRLRLEWVSSSEGARFAELMNDFGAELRALGPLDPGETAADGDAAGAATDLQLNLDALQRLIPFVKLVERGKLRAPAKSEEAYRTFYESEEVDRLFHDLVGDKLLLSRLLLLLEHEGGLNARELAARLGISPAAVSRQIKGASRRGLIEYDFERKCYRVAPVPPPAEPLATDPDAAGDAVAVAAGSTSTPSTCESCGPA